MDLIPIPDSGITFREEESGCITLLVHRKGFFDRLAQKLVHKSDTSEIELDEMGSFIWKLLDGRTTVYELGKPVREQFGEAAEPLYERIVKYMQILNSYRFVKFSKAARQ